MSPSDICADWLLNATRPSRDHPERHAHVRVILLRAPDVNQRSVCGGESGGIGRFYDVCAICATRLPNATAKIRWTNCVLQIFFRKKCKKNAKRNAPQNSHFHISTHRCIFNFFYNNIILYIIIIIHISQPTQMCGNVKMWIFLFIWLFLSRPNKFLLLHCKRLYLSILLKHIERTDSI